MKFIREVRVGDVYVDKDDGQVYKIIKMSFGDKAFHIDWVAEEHLQNRCRLVSRQKRIIL